TLPRPDLLIVARGGGSVEDLWGFNEEIVVRAAADSHIPLISAVGHETDTTLIDHASDKRAPTPTAAAELAVPVRVDLLGWLESQGARLTRGVASGLTQRRQRLTDLSRALPRVDTLLDGPRQRLDQAGTRLPTALLSGVQKRRVMLAERSGSLRPATLARMVRTETARLASLSSRLDPDKLRDRHERGADELRGISTRLARAASGQIERWRTQIAATDRMRETLSYKATLARGYAVVRGDDQVVTTRVAAGKAKTLEIEFADGRLSLDRPTRSDPAPRKATSPNPEQGSLF
ncbi:MAG: exodeoxyribonuclease VII large subunit, partial [Pseudomonadota bacterium]